MLSSGIYVHRFTEKKKIEQFLKFNKNKNIDSFGFLFLFFFCLLASKLTFFFVTISDFSFPIARLLFNVEG